MNKMIIILFTCCIVLDAAIIHESLAQRAAYPMQSVDASYPSKVGDDEEDDAKERQTYTEKRQFWEEITNSKKRDSYQRSESEVSRASQLTIGESDSECLHSTISELDTGMISGRSETLEDMNIPDISECSVAEKAHYFEEQIQREISKVPPKLHSQESLKDNASILSSVLEERIETKKEMIMDASISSVEKHLTEIGKKEKSIEPSKSAKDFVEEDVKRLESSKTSELAEISKKIINEQRQLAEEDIASSHKQKERQTSVEQVDTASKMQEATMPVAAEMDEFSVKHLKREFESKIPVSSKLEKDKTKSSKIPVLHEQKSATTLKRDTDSKPKKSPEFESKIPKRITEEKEAKKKKNELEAFLELERKLLEEELLGERKTIDTKSVKEVVSESRRVTSVKKTTSETVDDRGKTLYEGETQSVKHQESSKSIVSLEKPSEKIEEIEVKSKDIDKVLSDEITVSLVGDKKSVDATASQSLQETQLDSKQLKTDKELYKAESAKAKQEDIRVDIVGTRSTAERPTQLDTRISVKSKSTSEERVEAKKAAEDLVQSIETEIEKRSFESTESKSEFGGKISDEYEDERLADDLMKKFENIMQKVEGAVTTKTGGTMEQHLIEKVTDGTFERDSPRTGSISISEDLTRDEESSSQARLSDRDVTMSPSSISNPIEMEEGADTEHEFEIKEESVTAGPARDEPMNLLTEEYSGARVLEILEPGADSHLRRDSEVSQILHSDPVTDYRAYPRESISSIHESAAVDSLKDIYRDRDITVSPSTISEDVYSIHSHDTGSKRADSFEIESPPLISPRSKVKELEIKPVNWMIGDEKIEISETMEPSQAFDKELEEYQLKLRQDSSLSLDEKSAESITKSIEDLSSVDSVKELSPTGSPIIKATKFTVTPVPDRDYDTELVENKLDVSCQELVDTLQREYDAKTPTDDSARDEYEKLLEQKIKSLPKESFSFEEKEREDEPYESADVPESFSQGDGKSASAADQPLLDVHKPIDIDAIRSSIKTLDEQKSVITLEGLDASQPSKLKTFEETKKLGEKTVDKRDKGGHSVVSSEASAFKKKDDLPNVDLSARYAITVLDQVVKKEMAEVKESLEAAKQDLIEELSENSETVFQIKDSPSEFQFKLQPEPIPNDLPFLYTAPVADEPDRKEPDTARAKRDILPAKQDSSSFDSDSAKSPVARPRKREDSKETSSEDDKDPERSTTLKSAEVTTKITVQDDDREDDTHSAPVAASRSSSDMDVKDESGSFLTPQPAPRRRQKSEKTNRRAFSDTEDVCSSSGESSNYQSCAYDRSRPSSSDVEQLQSAGRHSTTGSEYETALTSMGSRSRPTSQEYMTAASTLSSRESMKSLNSLSSGHMGSLENTSELSETLVATETDNEKEDYSDIIDDVLEDERMKSDREDISDNIEEGPIDDEAYQGVKTHSDKEDTSENFEEGILDDDRANTSGSSESELPKDEAATVSENVPYRMKRSSEMVFQQIIDDDAMGKCEIKPVGKETTSSDTATSTTGGTGGSIECVDIMTARVTEDGVESVCTQVSSKLHAMSEPRDIIRASEPSKTDSLESKLSLEDTADDTMEAYRVSLLSQQASMSTSSTSAMSIETVIERGKSDSRHSPDSDSFELVDKPDLMDDFVVVEEVGKEAEEFDAEGKSIRITSASYSSQKKFDRDLENLLTEKKEAEVAPTSESSKNSELFEFDSEESPPQQSNEEQLSQSYSDEEQYENKRWMEMQFQNDPRAMYDVEYDRGPLEDIKEEEVTDFEAGSSRIGSMGSHKESIGSVGSMRGSYGSTPDYDVLAAKKFFTKPTDHDNVSLSSLQEFEHLESEMLQHSKKTMSGSQDSGSSGGTNGSLPKRYGRSGHGDDVSLSSLKDFENIEKACRDAHVLDMKVKEEQELLEHESPETKYKLECYARLKAAEKSTSGGESVNPSTSGSDDYEKRIKEIDEIIRIAQTNVEKCFERHDDTAEDISQIEATDEKDKIGTSSSEPIAKEPNLMETSTDSLELEEDIDKKRHPLCRSSDSLEMKTNLDYPSLSSDSLNNLNRETKDSQDTEQHGSGRRLSSDSLEVPFSELSEKDKDFNLLEKDRDVRQKPQ